jgi:two-component sensor histidine kinase/DNA-binding response OmpR family regulator
MMDNQDTVNILLVDDQPPKLLSYEVILGALGERLIKAASAREALEVLLKNDVAVILVDVCMPELDGFELAAMIREHPRFQKIAIIFISAVQISDVDRLRGYEMGAVDYVPVPVIPEVLRAKVRVFVELYRKTRQLEALNTELERRVAERTAALEMSTAQLRASEERRSLALAAGQMGSWDWIVAESAFTCDEGQFRIFGVEPGTVAPSVEGLRKSLDEDDWRAMLLQFESLKAGAPPIQSEFRIRRKSGEVRHCWGIAAATFDENGNLVRVSGLTMDITDRKRAEESQLLLAREVDHRARNALAVVQSIVRLTNAPTREAYITAIDGRIKALARAHTLLSEFRWQGADLNRLVSEEVEPYHADGTTVRISGPMVTLAPERAQAMGLSLHELATNAAKYGALSAPGGILDVHWSLDRDALVIEWTEQVTMPIEPPASRGFGTKVISASIEQLQGRTVFNWRPEGLHCVLRVPHHSLVRANGHARQRGGATEATASEGASSRRVLLVEDEALVAMMMNDLLEELDFAVVGPKQNLDEALSAVKSERLDAAILDVNVAGQTVYPVAAVLSARGVPFAFVTGYDSTGIDPRYAGIPVLQKPVDRERLAQVMTVLFAREPARPVAAVAAAPH